MDGADSSAAFPMKKFDVYISFRGTDVRRHFVCHLFAALCRRSIRSFIDDELEEGDEIGPSLVKAIEDSYVSLVVFSPNYASSRWCLEELTKIMDCKNRQGQVVIPVFYLTDPSDVRHQNGVYGEALAEHETRLNTDMIQKWKDALHEAASLSGLRSSNFRDDFELIEEIVNDVLQVLDKMFSIESMQKLVGIAARCGHIEPLLKKFPVVGICGVSGIGKTTIAKVVYAKLSVQFDCCCFFENVGENSKKYGLYYLHDKLLRELSGEGSSHVIAKGDKGSKYLLRSLGRKKVLAVLDGVDDSKQLEYLSKEFQDLREGSRVIIVTRDKHLLASTGVDRVYEVEELNFQEALQLFSLHALSQNYHKMAYEELTEKMVFYCKGIPLALKVCGSFLNSKTIGEWESVLAKFKMIPNNDIQNVLRLSYDGLDSHDKDIFLYIACLLNGEDNEHVTHLIDSLGYDCSVGLRNLNDRALVNISDNRVWMHDLLQKMGQDIVCGQYIEEYGRRIRLEDSKETDVYKENLGTQAVKGILLHKSQSADLHFANNLKKLLRTRTVKFYSPWIEQICKVHFLEDDELPPKSLPSKFCPEELVEIRMQNSHVVKLWDGVQDLANLKRINLDGCRQLREIPDFSKALNLEYIYLSNCKRLHHVNSSILSPPKLICLDLCGCKKLKYVGSKSGLGSLSQLTADGYSSLKEPSVSSEEMSYLDLSEMVFETTLYDVLGRLNTLLLTGCNVESLPASIKHLSCLEFLDIRDCRLLRSLPEPPQSIKYLLAQNCISLETVFIPTDELRQGYESWKGMKFSFTNCLKMNERSLDTIMGLAHFPIKEAESRKQKYYDMEVCLPGTRFPSWFSYRTTQACITIELHPCSDLLGFVFCINSESAESASCEILGHCRVGCACYLVDGSAVGHSWYGNIGLVSDDVYLWYDAALPWYDNITLVSDHLYLWYDAKMSNGILDAIKNRKTNDQITVSFEFFVTDGKTGRRSDKGIKECGVWPIYASEFENIANQMELCFQLGLTKKRSRDVFELELGKTESEVGGSGREFEMEDELELTESLHNEHISDFGLKKGKVLQIYASEYDNSTNQTQLSLQLGLTKKRSRDIFELESGQTEIGLGGPNHDFEKENEPKLTEGLSDEDVFDFGSAFETLKVTDVSQLKELPPNLHSLRVVGCHLLKSLTDELMDKPSNVSELHAIDCPSLKYLVGGGNFTSLRTLYIHKCRKVEFLLSPENFAYLEHLCIGSSCDSLKYFTLNHFPKLKTLCIWNCPNLESLSISEEFEHGDLPLESIEIRDCPRLVSFPTNGFLTPNLMSLTFSNCVALASFPNEMASLESLQTIFIDRCPKLDSFPEGGLPSSLILLSIASCDRLIPKKEWELNRLHSLTSFEIESGCVGMESFPEKDLLPINLNSLRISKMLSLSFLDYNGLQQLTALQSLDINCCLKLSSIPDEGLPSSLASLSIKESPLLTQNLIHKMGADWSKIAHIPDIRIEDFISRNSEEVSFILGNGII